MPVTSIRSLEIHYEILGDRGPWVALQPGGRRAGASLRPLAAKIAEAAVAGATPLSQNGYKVTLARVAVKRALLAAAGKA